MLKFTKFPISLTLLSICSSHIVHADDFQIGDSRSDLGSITFSGWLRANIQDKSYSDNEHKLKFDAAKFALQYDAKQLFGNFEYRCYQFDQICDFSSLVNANLGYKIDQNNRVTLGVQDVPFGPGRGWSTNWFGGIAVTAGLEDVHNLGINFNSQITDNTKIDIAYFARDGGNYVGHGKDASRYSVNYVEPDDPNNTYLQEKNMIVTRIDQKLPQWVDGLNISLGGSYWYSQLDNKTNNETGHRNSWAIFSRANYNNVNLTLTGGKNKITNKDPLQPDYSVMGSFDTNYYVANDADFYTIDINYTFKDPHSRFSLTPYATYSLYKKNVDDYKSSTRHAIGTQLDIKKFSFAAEYIIGKNDAFINGNSQSLAMGDDNTSNKMLNLLFFYNF
ncbi:hypothetical protein RKQ52_01540 [Acinetobacter baumannii]|uniref:hypothetical protein n=1 Tax=Acinetobacter baumannii TaxID=470 RepID=UPI002711CC6B|nr:hypothetical protein [Acinetobacter baumannii]